VERGGLGQETAGPSAGARGWGTARTSLSPWLSPVCRPTLDYSELVRASCVIGRVELVEVTEAMRGGSVGCRKGRGDLRRWSLLVG